MTDFLSLKEVMDGRLKKPFIATCIAVGDVQNGKRRDGGDWSRQPCTVEDATAKIEFSLWNEEIGTVTVGHKYELAGYWKEFEGRPQFAIGKWGVVKCVGSAAQTELPPSEPAKSETPPPVSSDMPESTVKAIMEWTRKIREAEGIIRNELSDGNPAAEVSPAKVGMYLKLIIEAGALK